MTSFSVLTALVSLTILATMRLLNMKSEEADNEAN